MLQLRLSLRLGDWSLIRRMLNEKPPTCTEADSEISYIFQITENNARMHRDLTTAISEGKITGVYSHLTVHTANVGYLLQLIRDHEDTPRISQEDMKLMYTAEIVKEIRTHVTMHDYAGA